MKAKKESSFLGRVFHKPQRVHIGRENLKGLHKPDERSITQSNILVIESSVTGRTLFSVNM